MSSLSWKNPPAVVVIAGTEHFLRKREVDKAIRLTIQDRRSVAMATSDAEVRETLNIAATFGDASLVVVDVTNINEDTVRAQLENPPPKTCILITSESQLDLKKHPFLDLVHAGLRAEFNTPSKAKEAQSKAVQLARQEAERLLGPKDAIDDELAQALVRNVGSDLGVVAFEISKVTAFVRSQGRSKVGVDDLRKTIRPKSDIDMEPIREALRARDAERVASALDRMRRSPGQDPLMLLLRARGGPADLSRKWLLAALLLEKGSGHAEIATRTGTPEWAVQKDIISAAKLWGKSALRSLVSDLSRVDQSVLKGDPSPWVALESALLLGCSQSR